MKAGPAEVPLSPDEVRQKLSPKARLLLNALETHDPEPLPVMKIALSLWPDQRAINLRHNVQVQAARLCAAMRPAGIELALIPREGGSPGYMLRRS